MGGGPAGLACAIKTMQLLEDEPELAEKLGEVPVAVIEKGKVCGAHLLSGANMRPSAMEELFPDLDPSEWPVYQEVTKDAVYLLTKRSAIPLKPPAAQLPQPRQLRHLDREAGPVPGREGRGGGRLPADRDRGRQAPRRGPHRARACARGTRAAGETARSSANFEPGSDVVAKATVLAEGTQGHLTGAAMDFFELHGLEPQRWELGVKEIWEVEKPLDRVIHTMGWPLRKGAKWNEFGGSFIYPMGEDKVCIGSSSGLDYTDATFSVHDTLQEFKTHPFVRKILEGGKRVGWGAKTIPSGGYWALPRTFTVPGMVMCGDGAGMCNVSELKGIHYAMHAGMYAAEEIVAALKQDSVNFDAYDERVRNSAITQDLYRWRNIRQAFARGFFFGGAVANMALSHAAPFRPAAGASTPTPRRRWSRMARPSATRSRTTSTRSTSSRRCSPRATPPATTRPTTSRSSGACRARWPRPGSRCAPRRSTRSRRTRRRTAPRRST